MTQYEFIKAVAPAAVKMAMRYKVPASLLIAQPILESRYGNSGLAINAKNLTGMKATGAKIEGVWDGKKINMPTREVIKGMDVTIPQNFRAYDSWEQSIEDLAHRYAKRFNLTLDKVGGNVDQFLAEPGMGEAMKTGYATDPHYEQLIKGIIEKYNLKQFDRVTVNISPGQKKKSGFSETKAA